MILATGVEAMPKQEMQLVDGGYKWVIDLLKFLKGVAEVAGMAEVAMEIGNVSLEFGREYAEAYRYSLINGPVRPMR